LALITWNDTYSVGVPAMDQQHHRLVATLNELHDAMRNGTAKQATTALVEKLVKYTLEHFAAEEQLMQRAAYPKLLAHQRLHADLRRQVEKYLERSRKGDLAISIDLMTFLKD